MTKRAKRPEYTSQGARVIGEFRVGESIPLKGCWLKVAHVETGVLVLALESYTKRGQEILDEMKARMAVELASPVHPEEPNW